MTRAGRHLRGQQAHDRTHEAAAELWRNGDRARAVLDGRFPVTLTPAQGCAIDFARDAARRTDGDWSFVFHRCMPADLRHVFDTALVALQHPSAWLAGTTENRFAWFVRELRIAA